MKDLESEKDEDDEIDDLYYDVKTDEEFVEEMKRRKQIEERQKKLKFGKFNKKTLKMQKSAPSKVLLDVINEEDNDDSLNTDRE